jgi:hypothetical protein
MATGLGDDQFGSDQLDLRGKAFFWMEGSASADANRQIHSARGWDEKDLGSCLYKTSKTRCSTPGANR